MTKSVVWSMLESSSVSSSFHDAAAASKPAHAATADCAADNVCTTDTNYHHFVHNNIQCHL